MYRKGRITRSLTSVIIAAIAAGALMLTACSSKDDKKKNEIEIGVSVYNEHDTFVSQLMDYFDECVAEHNASSDINIVVTTYNAAGSQLTQNSQVEEMIDRGCDVICVNLVDRTDTSMIIEKAREANVPVIFFNREPVSADLQRWNRLYYIGGDAAESGMLQAQTAAEAISSVPGSDRNGDGRIQYVMLEGEAGHQDAIVRSEVSVNTLINMGIDLDRLTSVTANWNRNQAATRMSQIIDDYGDDIELVIANNDDMALGAIDEYESRGIALEDRPIIVGIDGTDVGLEAVDEGLMFGTVYNDKEGQAEALLELAIAASDDTAEAIDRIASESGRDIRIPYAVITRENVSEFMN